MSAFGVRSAAVKGSEGCFYHPASTSELILVCIRCVETRADHFAATAVSQCVTGRVWTVHVNVTSTRSDLACPVVKSVSVC